MDVEDPHLAGLSKEDRAWFENDAKRRQAICPPTDFPVNSGVTNSQQEYAAKQE